MDPITNLTRLAIISATGTAQKRTIPSLAGLPNIKVSAIYGRDKSKLELLASRYGIAHVFTDLQAMLESGEFDAIFIASPPFLHKEHIFAAARASKPIFCEKPLCIDLADADEIVRVVTELELPFRVAHHVRHQRAIADIKTELRTGTLGSIRSASMQWSFLLNPSAPNAEWKLNPRLGGPNSFYDAGVHAVDLALHLFGAPRSVQAMGVSTVSSATFDTCMAIMKYDQFHVALSCSQSQAPFANDLVISGSAGTLRAAGALNEKSIAVVEIQTAEGRRALEYEAENLYRNEVIAFAESNRTVAIGHQDPLDNCTSLAEAALAVRILEAIQKSIETGLAINIA